ncbi:MAG: hypothetical protein C4297_09465 [Gemmataceae bacterium]
MRVNLCLVMAFCGFFLPMEGTEAGAAYTPPTPVPCIQCLPCTIVPAVETGRGDERAPSADSAPCLSHGTIWQRTTSGIWDYLSTSLRNRQRLVQVCAVGVCLGLYLLLRR